MIRIEYIDKAPENSPCRAYIGSCESKPHAKVVELNSAQKREFIVRNEDEESGVALYKLVSAGIDKELVLECGLDVLTGFILESFRFDSYKTDAQTPALEKLLVVCKERSLFENRLKTLEGVFYARTLTSEPPNVLYPNAYAERLYELESLGVVVHVLDETELEQFGFAALLAAARGSANRPRVVVLQWTGSDAAPIALVGKGVCFDSGGLCLKTRDHMQLMKWDKAGAGVVAGVMKALALQKAKCSVIGVLGLIENMPDGGAARPGDVIKTCSGITVEIADTDAEGRLVLADCISYVQRQYHPQVIIDLGTLTVETFATLGGAYAGLYSNDKELVDELKKAGDASHERLWELPMGPYFAKQIESTIADIKNVGVDFAGESGAAAEFIKRFVNSGTPWAHIDISGVSWTQNEPKTVTGFGVRLLMEWLQHCTL